MREGKKLFTDDSVATQSDFPSCHLGMTAELTLSTVSPILLFTTLLTRGRNNIWWVLIRYKVRILNSVPRSLSWHRVPPGPGLGLYRVVPFTSFELI